MFCEVFIMDYLTTKQAAEKWNISLRRVQVLCEQGRIKELYAWDGHGRYLRMLKNLRICG